jgi:hypothetical protein
MRGHSRVFETEQPGYGDGDIEVKEERCGSILRMTDLPCSLLKQALRSTEHNILTVVLVALFFCVHSHVKQGN